MLRQRELDANCNTDPKSYIMKRSIEAGQRIPGQYSPRMQQWEYKIIKRGDLSEAKLNQLGAEGWELIPMVLPQCNIPNSFDEIEVEVVMRRPVAQ